MTVRLINDSREFLCLSSDTMPHLTGVGAKMSELDTGLQYRWDGTEWMPDLTLFAAMKLALEEAT